jgi:hypothetical protein
MLVYYTVYKLRYANIYYYANYIIINTVNTVTGAGVLDTVYILQYTNIYVQIIVVKLFTTASYLPQLGVCVFKIAGRQYRFDAAGNPLDHPGTTEALRIIAQNPAACAHFVDAYIRAFTDVFMGWPIGAKEQQNPNCLFGIVWLLYWSFESNSRPGKHGHGGAVQPALHTARLHDLLQEGTAVRMQLFGFLESLMCSYMPTATSDSLQPDTSCDPAAASSCDAAAFSAQFAWDSSEHAPTPHAAAVLLQRFPLDGSMSLEQTLEYLRRVTPVPNGHRHTFTCKKGGRAGDDSDCRMDYMRLLVPQSQLLPGRELVLLRRDRGDLVPYIRSLMLAAPGNHTMQLSVEVSRWLRQQRLCVDAIAAGHRAVSMLF